MQRKKMALWTALGFVTVGALLTLLGVLLKHEPSFFSRVAVGQGKARNDLNNEFSGNILKLGTFWREGKGDWSVTFSEAQINSYFLEGFVRWGDAEALRKQGISEPRVMIDQDRLRVAFRYGSGLLSTIISYDLKIWLAPKEVNTILVEIAGHHAGGLPMSSQSLLNDISEAARRRNIDVTWYRHESRPVAMIRFPDDQTRPTAQLTGLEARLGALSISGKSNDARPAPEPLISTPGAGSLLP